MRPPASRKAIRLRMKEDRSSRRRKITTKFWIHYHTEFSKRASGSRSREQVVPERLVCNRTVPSHTAETVIIINNHPPSSEDNSKPVAISLWSCRDNTYHRLPSIPQVESSIPWNCQCVGLGDKLYVLGGTTEPMTSVNTTLPLGSKEVYVVDLSGQRQWKRCALMQEARADFQSGVIDGKIYVYGGTSLDTVFLSRSEVYDPTIDEWSTMSLEEGWWYLQGLLKPSIAFYALKVQWTAVVYEDAQGSTSWEELQPSHDKKIYTNYTITRVAGDGRCLFRSIAHGSSLRCGNGILDEEQQRDRADDLQNKAADELVRGRHKYEFMILGDADFDDYVERMRDPAAWGGETEIVLLTRVLQMPITVYMADVYIQGGVVSIGDYGQEYGTDHPVQILFSRLGPQQSHYEALQVYT